MSPEIETINDEVYNYAHKMHNLVNLSFFITLPITMIIDIYTLSGFPYTFTLIWKTIMFIVTFIIFYIMKIKFLKPDLPVQITLSGIFIPFSYLISIVDASKITFLNLTFMICLAGLSTILIIQYKRMLIFIISTVISYLIFFFIINPHTIQQFFDNLAVWNLVFLIIIPLISNFNYQRTYKEIYIRYILQEKNNEITRQSQEITLQKDKLVELNNTKDKFFSIISHDLKNPISSLSISLNNLYTDFQHLDEVDKIEILKLLKESSSNLYELLENLLDWSRAQRNVITFNPTSFEINYLVNNNIKIFENSAKNKSISIEFIPNQEYNAFADVSMINAVLRNLISNSIKFTRIGGNIQINVSNYDENFINISIKDNGIGMTEDIINNLFKIDKNVSRIGTNDELGTGLGLILCKEFIEKNDGKIWVTSQENSGTEIFFTVRKYIQNISEA